MAKIQTFESNSQQCQFFSKYFSNCSRWQRYKLLKAIHNGGDSKMSRLQLFKMAKIQTFESNSQRMLRILIMIVNCSRWQRYKLLKAIHNTLASVQSVDKTVQDGKDTNF